MTPIGRLEPVPLRRIWPNEAADFTPWLASNLDVLGQAVGLALELRHREYPVGRYALDLLLQDAEGRVVIVENQLEQTDHGHLGQLLTYCAGTGAELVIWIAQSMTPEHVGALEWLNENTITGVGFFGIEVEALRIADSPPAPSFKVIVRPNDWAKDTRRNRLHAETWTWEMYASELHIPVERMEVGKDLLAAITTLAEDRGLPWQVVMNKGYVAIQRPGGYNVFVVDLLNRDLRLKAKVPAAPQELGLVSPFPDLPDTWSSNEREWIWTIPSNKALPDVRVLFDLVEPFHPASGPMTTEQATSGPSSSAGV